MYSSAQVKTKLNKRQKYHQKWTKTHPSIHLSIHHLFMYSSYSNICPSIHGWMDRYIDEVRIGSMDGTQMHRLENTADKYMYVGMDGWMARMGEYMNR